MENKSGYKMPGRPPRNPNNKVGQSVRCMTTIGVKNALIDAGRKRGTNPSDTLRLAIYRLLEHEGLLSSDLKKDTTWDELRKLGLI